MTFGSIMQELSMARCPLYQLGLELKCRGKPETDGSSCVQISGLLAWFRWYFKCTFSKQLAKYLGHNILCFPRHLCNRSVLSHFPQLYGCRSFSTWCVFSSRCTLSPRGGQWHRSCTAMSRTGPRSRWFTRRTAPPTPLWTPQSTLSFTSIPWKLRRHVWFWAHPLLAPRKWNYFVGD